ncbi:hypothetical protein [Micromonospora profundi]|uniref:hypothetical protein n=1 Tax=Micromonospora profundi TaxID=1420889 RepID=UPI00364806A6
MRWLRWLRAFLTNQATLAALLVDVESERDRLAAMVRRMSARHELELQIGDAEVAAFRREAESLDAANVELIRQNCRERAWSNTLAHRLRKGHEFAANLPDVQAAELRALLSPAFPSLPEEATHGR